MRTLIDTGVLWRPSAIRALMDRDDNLVLPAVAYAERVRQLAAAGRAHREIDSLLDAAQVLVEPFGIDEARRLPKAAIDDANWRRNFRDAMIAAHLRPGDTLWTTNPRDFLALGVPAGNIVAVA